LKFCRCLALPKQQQHRLLLLSLGELCVCNYAWYRYGSQFWTNETIHLCLPDPASLRTMLNKFIAHLCQRWDTISRLLLPHLSAGHAYQSHGVILATNDQPIAWLVTLTEWTRLRRWTCVGATPFPPRVQPAFIFILSFTFTSTTVKNF